MSLQASIILPSKKKDLLEEFGNIVTEIEIQLKPAFLHHREKYVSKRNKWYFQACFTRITSFKAFGECK